MYTFTHTTVFFRIFNSYLQQSLTGKRKGECYDNQALMADLESCDSHSLTLHLNLSLAQHIQADNEALAGQQDTRRDSGVGSSLTRTSMCVPLD